MGFRTNPKIITQMRTTIITMMTLMMMSMKMMVMMTRTTMMTMMTTLHLMIGSEDHPKVRSVANAIKTSARSRPAQV